MVHPTAKDILLIGGGHSHALALRMWGMNPIAGLRLTLVSPSEVTPYSGMLPGLIAGHYRHEETHIDLVKLCAWAKVRFIQAEVTHLNASQNYVCLNDRPNLDFDICSIDIGSKPDHSIEGSQEFGIGIKPIDEFYAHWNELKSVLLHHRDKKALNIAVIGGGHGGVEVILAMHHWTIQNHIAANFSLVHRGTTLFEQSSKSQQKRLFQLLKESNIQLHLNFDCLKISATHLHSIDKKIEVDKVFYCTHAAAASWLKNSCLELNQQGFIHVNDHLQSVNQPHIFAAGDICCQISAPRPKAGVYAVRMAPVLIENLINFNLNKGNT